MTAEKTALALMLTLPLWLAALLAWMTGAAASWSAVALGWGAWLAVWRGICLARAGGGPAWLAGLSALAGAGAPFLPMSAGLITVLCALLAVSWLTLEAGAERPCGAEPAIFTAAAAPLFSLALGGLA